MMGVRAQQKEKTRRSLVEAAFSQLSAERSFASLSLREVAREAGIAPTSFYRHFRDVDELGLTMVDESGLMLRQLMRQARLRIAKGGSVIRTSVSTFMEFIGNNPNAFRLLLRERSGTRTENNGHHRLGLCFSKRTRHMVFEFKIVGKFRDEMLNFTRDGGTKRG